MTILLLICARQNTSQDQESEYDSDESVATQDLSPAGTPKSKKNKETKEERKKRVSFYTFFLFDFLLKYSTKKNTENKI